MDIMNFKFKKLDLKGKGDRLTKKPKLKEVQIPKPKNLTSGLNKQGSRVFKVAKGSRSLKINKSLNNNAMSLKMKNTDAKLKKLLGRGKKTGVKFGIERIRQQKGLKPMGDFDGDGLKNALDCNPRNKFLQGPEQTIEDKINPSDELRRNLGETKQPFDEPTQAERDAEFKAGLKAGDESGKRMQRQQAQAQAFTIDEPTQQAVGVSVGEKESRLKKVARATGQFLEGFAKEEKQAKAEFAERDADLRAKAQRKAEKDIERARVARQVRIIKAERGAPTRIQRQKQAAGQALKQVGGTFGVIGSIGPRQQRILELLGKAPPQQVQQPGQAPLTQAQSACAIQSDPSKGVISPHSKRRVAYVRGPYRK